jgi:hypothetical protein
MLLIEKFGHTKWCEKLPYAFCLPIARIVGMLAEVEI